MLKHYFTFLYRNFVKHRSFLFINLIGLSTGIACTLLIYLWIKDELNFDGFHLRKDRLYQVMHNQKNAGAITTVEFTPSPLADALVNSFAEVEYAVSTSNPTWFGRFSLSVEERYFKAVGHFATEDFFRLFSYDLLQGDASNVLKDRRSVVISKDLAIRLFGMDEVVGRVLTWHWLGVDEQFQVSGVFANVPANSSVKFEFVLPWEVILDRFPHYKEWGNNGPSTFVLLKEGIDAERFNHKITNLLKTKVSESENTLFVRRYSDSYLYGKFENGKQAGGRIEYVKLFAIIAIFILLIACINFMNLSTAKVSGRVKEIGIKKALGAYRGSLVVQFLGESIFMAFISLSLAVMMVLLVLPQFNAITGKDLSFSTDIKMIGVLVCIALVTGLVSGSYPALYLSGFKPAAVLKGQFKNSIGELWARQGLVVFQFSLSVILIVAVMIVYQQIQFIQTKNLGYNKDNILYFENEGKISTSLDAFLAEMKKISGVVNASSIMENIVGASSTTDGVNWAGKDDGEEVSFNMVTVNYDMIETLGIGVDQGRSFSRDFQSDDIKIVLNQTAVEVMKLEDPIGKTINLWGEDREIIGVVKDFNFQSFYEKVRPLLFRLAPDETMKVMVKIKAGEERETIREIQGLYTQFNVGYPFDFGFLDQDYQKLYISETRVSALSWYFAGLAILISCLGLFGLAAFTAQRKVKEIAIRKALGSTSVSIIFLLSKSFTKMVLCAIVIALPISYFIVQHWLDNFVYRINIHPWYFILSGLIALGIAWLTVAYQTLKATKINPAESLRINS